MAIKTFNIDEETYKQFSNHCKEHGISMSKKIEKFIQKEIEQLKIPEQPKTSIQQNNLSHPLKKYC